MPLHKIHELLNILMDVPISSLYRIVVCAMVTISIDDFFARILWSGQQDGTLNVHGNQTSLSSVETKCPNHDPWGTIPLPIIIEVQN